MFLYPRLNELECDHGKDVEYYENIDEFVIYQRYHSRGDMYIDGEYFAFCGGDEVIDNLNCLNTQSISFTTVNRFIKDQVTELSIAFPNATMILETHCEMGCGGISLYRNGEHESICSYSFNEDPEQNIIYYFNHNFKDVEYAYALYQSFEMIKDAFDKDQKCLCYTMLKKNLTNLKLKYELVGIRLSEWLMDMVFSHYRDHIEPSKVVIE